MPPVDPRPKDKPNYLEGWSKIISEMADKERVDTRNFDALLDRIIDGLDKTDTGWWARYERAQEVANSIAGETTEHKMAVIKAKRWIVRTQLWPAIQVAIVMKVVYPPSTAIGMKEMIAEVAKDRADWLVDAVAAATQNRVALRGDEAEDKVLTEAIFANGEKAIVTAITKLFS